MTEANYRGFLNILKNPLILGIRNHLKEGYELFLDGLKSSITPFVISLCLEHLDNSALIIIQDEGDLESLTAELKIWTRNRDIYPYPFVDSSISSLEHTALLQQMKSIRAMLENDSEKVPIVAVTADTSNETRAKCLDSGMDDFITKPFTKDTLIGILKKHLKRF